MLENYTPMFYNIYPHIIIHMMFNAIIGQSSPVDSIAETYKFGSHTYFVIKLMQCEIQKEVSNKSEHVMKAMSIAGFGLSIPNPANLGYDQGPKY